MELDYYDAYRRNAERYDHAVVEIRLGNQRFLNLIRGNWIFQIACSWLSWINASRDSKIVSILTIFQLKNFVNPRTWYNLFAVCRLRFQTNQKIEPCNLWKSIVGLYHHTNLFISQSIKHYFDGKDRTRRSFSSLNPTMTS